MTHVDEKPGQSTSAPPPLREQVESALHTYLAQLDGHAPDNLYKLVLQEVESPLLETVMRYTGGNQSKAADILGINRTTLRKKLKQYDLE
jgi:Fis family transcriptional regulator